jgi:Tfp pilus assembly protein PilO
MNRIVSPWIIYKAWALALLRHLGWSAALGVALLLTAVVLWAGAAPALQQLTSRVELENEDLHQRLSRAAQPSAAAGQHGDPVRALNEQLPTADRLPAFLDTVYQRAAAGRLTISRTEYRRSAPTAGVQRFRIVLPVQGRYPELRIWLEKVLAAHPSAALDELLIRRSGDEVEARVQLSFFWKVE